MNYRSQLALALSLLMACGFVTLAHAQDVPSEALTRRAVDQLIKDAPDHRATLGLLEGTMELSISYGAPAWNAGDHEACCRFYVTTAKALCAAFDAQDKASGPAKGILGDLHSALDRVGISTDVDANAWAMRFVFDKTTAELSLQIDRSVQMGELGRQCAARSDFADAADAFGEATAALHEIRGVPMEEIPVECRYMPLALSEALFGQKKFAESAAAVEDGLIYIPDFGAHKIDMRKHFADPAVYQLLLDDLHAAAEQKPKDASLQLLYGFHLMFTGHKDDAKVCLEKAKELDPALMPGKLLSPPPAVKEAEPTTRPSMNRPSREQGV